MVSSNQENALKCPEEMHIKLAYSLKHLGDSVSTYLKVFKHVNNI